MITNREEREATPAFRPALKECLEKLLEKHSYDPENDPRLVGGTGFTRIRCSVCEDDGIVFFSISRPERRHSIVMARCTCPQGEREVPAIYKAKGDRIVCISSWKDVRHPRTKVPYLGEEDLVPLRLRPYMSGWDGRLALTHGEPRRVVCRRMRDGDRMRTEA